MPGRGVLRPARQSDRCAARLGDVRPVRPAGGADNGPYVRRGVGGSGAKSSLHHHGGGEFPRRAHEKKTPAPTPRRSSTAPLLAMGAFPLMAAARSRPAPQTVPTSAKAAALSTWHLRTTALLGHA